MPWHRSKTIMSVLNAMLTQLSKYVFYPLWEMKDGAHRLQDLRELSESQWLSAEALQQRQWRRLQEMVAYAGKNCRHYVREFASLGFDGNLASWDDFRRLPMLSKQDIRERSDDILSSEYRREDLVEARTGGSTGKSLTLYFDKRCQEIRNAAAMRSDQWAGWDIGMKVGAVWGNPPVADTLKKKLRSALLDRTIYLDTMNLSEESVHRFVTACRQQGVQALFGHSHSIYMLALYVQRLGIVPSSLKGIVSTSMMLLEPERRVIEAVFGCKVSDRYGCEEVSLIASECEKHEGMHLNVDHLVIEFLREDGTEAKAGEEGSIVVTDLLNRAMPLIRYRVEDMGVPSDRRCSCGRGLPLMERVVGRQADFLKRLDGSLVAGVSLVERTLTSIDGIQQMQLVQDSLQEIRTKVVSDASFDDRARAALRDELQSVFGPDVAIVIEEVAKLSQTRAGKYRFSICNV
jgi:phenylacetate-coenzyme A ligase PaaK-like adenylate-forming protein